MRSPIWHFLLIFPFAIILGVGCTGSQTKNGKKEDDKGSARRDDESLPTIFRLIQGSPNISACRDVTRKVNSYLSRHPEAQAKISLSDAHRDLLKSEYLLAPEEINFVARPDLQQIDAHHLEICLRLRDVGNSMTLQNLPPIDAAKAAFNWVNRHVILDSARDYLVDVPTSKGMVQYPFILPPRAILRIGRGSAEERCLVFLDLLKQLDLLGCAIGVPGDLYPKIWAAGVVVNENDKKSIYLFDLRVGLPIPNKTGNGIATLTEIRNDPSILQQWQVAKELPYDIGEKDVKASVAYVTCSLESLSPRMRFLQEEINLVDRVSLAVDPELALKNLRSVSPIPVKVWNFSESDKKVSPPSPIRALRYYLPADQGGMVPDSPMFAAVQKQMIPVSEILQRYRSYNLVSDLPPDSLTRLIGLSSKIYELYVLEPADDLKRGRSDDILKPLNRINNYLTDINSAPLSQSLFRSKLAEWVEDLRKAHLAAAEGNPNGAAAVERLWNADQYIFYVMQPSGNDLEIPKTVQPDIVSFLLLRSMAEPLSRERERLIALYWREKAAQFENQTKVLKSDGKKPSDNFKDRSANAWANAIAEMGQWSREYSIAPAAIESRIRKLKTRWLDKQLDIDILENFFINLHFNAGMASSYADALIANDEKQMAKTVLTQLKSDLAALRSNELLRSELKQFTERIAQFPNPVARAQLESRVKMFQDCLNADGSLYWMELHANLRLASLN